MLPWTYWYITCTETCLFLRHENAAWHILWCHWPYIFSNYPVSLQCVLYRVKHICWDKFDSLVLRLNEINQMEWNTRTPSVTKVDMARGRKCQYCLKACVFVNTTLILTPVGSKPLPFDKPFWSIARDPNRHLFSQSDQPNHFWQDFPVNQLETHEPPVLYHATCIPKFS